jgi:hypothetical protein
MRAIHLVKPNTTGGVEPLCGSWGSMDTDWTTVASQVTCAECAAGARLLATDSATGRHGARSP